eukprot:5815597-Amphidinium_carterae.1
MGKLSGSKFQSPRMKICRLPSAATAAKISRQTSRLSLSQRVEDGAPIDPTPNECPSPSSGEAAPVCKAKLILHWACHRFSWLV